MERVDNRIVAVCDPSCEGHKGKFRVILAPEDLPSKDGKQPEYLDFTPDQLASAFDQFMGYPQGEKAMVTMIAKMLEVIV